MAIYVVQPQDTVDRIAQIYGVTSQQLIYDNQLVYPYRLAVGQAVFVPDGELSAQRRTIKSNGYAYPFISPWVLEQTLPYLTELYVFSYGFTAEGEVIFPVLPDEWMIDAALGQNVLPVLTLTPFGADGKFNNQLIHAVVNNMDSQKRLIEQLLIVMKQKNYRGIDIDFEYILAEDRDAFTEFVTVMSEAMHEEGYQLSVALAPKVSADQPGLLYQGKDYRAIGQVADHVMLMTYEWGYTYGPPMAVAPLNKVRQVVEYAVTEIDPVKIRLGIPNYGYDWPLPFVAGSTKAVTIGNVEAVQIAIRYGSVILFDVIAQSPYFTYDIQNVTHEVWFEDVQSLDGKFDLIEEFNLQGCGYWQIMQLFRACWLLQQERFIVQKSRQEN